MFKSLFSGLFLITLLLVSQDSCLAATKKHSSRSLPKILLRAPEVSTNSALLTISTRPKDSLSKLTLQTKAVSGEFKTIKSFRATSFRKYPIKGLSPGTSYYFRVQGIVKFKTAKKRVRATTYSYSSTLQVKTKGHKSSTPTPTPTISNSVISLPIFVGTGAGGTATKTVSLNLDSTQAQATALWMQVHGLTYENKMSVSFNNAAWIPINNTSVAVADPGKSFGGIGGQFATLKITLSIPDGALKTGTNTIAFKFNGTDGTSNSFRVLKFNLLSLTGGKLLPDSLFTAEDPNSWQPPYADATSIAAGKSLWTSGVLKASPLDPTRVLKATCSDCHMSDGRDLKYFNYSNESIKERAVFHGLTETQGYQIASYIRSLSVPNPGRPWNPPFQPGPGIDAKPSSDWIAGAGVDYALDNDTQTIPYIFPNGITKDAIPTSGTLKVREIPVALQLIDWNHWLPTDHPKDSSMASEFLASNIMPRLSTMISKLSSSSKDTYITGNSYGISALSNDLYNWFIVDRSRDLLLVYPGSSTHPWSAQVAEEVYSLAQWMMVKYLGMAQEFGLEKYGTAIFGSTGESLTLPGPGAFMTSPFMSLIRNQDSGTLSLGTLRATYLSNTWYHIQVITNAGNRKRGGTNPVDWPYYYGFVKDMNLLTRLPEAGRLTLLVIKAMQESDNATGLNKSYGWDPTFAADAHILVNREFDKSWVTYQQPVKTAILQAVLGAWFDKSKQFTASQYQSSFLMTNFTNGNWMGPNNEYWGPFLNRIFYMIPVFRNNGVDQTLINNVADWAKAIYPQATWEQLKTAVGTWLSRLSPADGSVVTAGSLVTLKLSIGVVRPARIDFYDGSTFLGGVTDYNHSTGQYEFPVTLTSGAHRLYAKATTTSGVITTSWITNITAN